MQVCGNIDSDSGVYRLINQTEDLEKFNHRFALFEQSHDSWLRSCIAAVIRDVSRAKAECVRGNHENLDKLRAIYSATLKEVQGGLMGPAMSEKELRSQFTKEGTLTCRVQRRFAIYQGSTPRTCQQCYLSNTQCSQCQGLFMPKLRNCDDCKASDTNSNTRMIEGISCPSFEFPARVAGEIYTVCQRLDIQRPALILGLEDLASAFRRVPTSQPQYTIVVLYDPSTDSIVFHQVYGMCFGLSSAPLQFNRVPEFLCTLARVALAVLVDHYYDDFTITDILGSTVIDDAGCYWSSSAQFSLAILCELAGFGFEIKKRKAADSINEGLGVKVDLSKFQLHSIIAFMPTKKRVREVLRDLQQSQLADEMPPSAAQSFQGRLSFTLTAAFGCVGRAAIQPLIHRGSHPAIPASSSALSHRPWRWCSAMSKMLTFFTALFPILPPLVFDFSRPLQEKIVIYTDASCSAKLCALGIVFLIDGQRFRLRKELEGRILRCFKSNLRIINQLELLAMLCSVLTLDAKFLQNRQVVFFCDNTSALSAAVHGYSKATDMANMTNELHLQLAKLQVSAWFEWVPSLANIADIPSRVETASEFAYYKALDIQEWPGVFQLPSPDTVAHEDLDSLKWLTGGYSTDSE